MNHQTSLLAYENECHQRLCVAVYCWAIELKIIYYTS